MPICASPEGGNHPRHLPTLVSAKTTSGAMALCRAQLAQATLLQKVLQGGVGSVTTLKTTAQSLKFR